MPASCCSRRCFSSVRLRRTAESSFSNFQPPSPSNCSKCVWYFLNRREMEGCHKCFPTSGSSPTPNSKNTYHREGRWVMDSSAIPASLAAWKILPSTSMLTALVHSSRRAYFGLRVGVGDEESCGFPTTVPFPAHGQPLLNHGPAVLGGGARLPHVAVFLVLGAPIFLSCWFQITQCP